MPSISAPVIAAGLLGAGSIASAGIGAYSANQAAQTEAKAANNATNTQLGIFNQTQANLAPYNQAGQSALSQLASLFGIGTGGAAGTGPTASTAANATSALTQYPGYQFGLKQGQSALASSAASQGLLLSGGQFAAQQQYGQNYAMQNAWQPYVSQLNSLAGLGENAAATTGNIGASTGSSVANTEMAAGQATASGIMGSSNAITGGIQSGLQNAALMTLLGGSGGGSSPGQAVTYGGAYSP
jgi:hypothetical protein